jgi:hypothetical protein
MSSSATKKSAQDVDIPIIVGFWDLEFRRQHQFASLNSFQIYFQEPGANLNRIFGSVSSAPPGRNVYAIQNGQITIEQVTNNPIVSFDVTINGTVHTFTGAVEGSTINSLAPADLSGGAPSDEGSWSAQAQGGPGEEKEKKHPRKHTKRSAR